MNSSRRQKGDSCFTWKNLKQLLRNGSESSGAAARTSNAVKTSVTPSFNRFFAIYLLVRNIQGRPIDHASDHFSNNCLDFNVRKI